MGRGSSRLGLWTRQRLQSVPGTVQSFAASFGVTLLSFELVQSASLISLGVLSTSLCVQLLSFYSMALH